MIWGFMRSFGWPFISIVVPLWVYLRSKYGVIKVPIFDNIELKNDISVTIKGENKSDTLTINELDFIYVQSQQN